MASPRNAGWPASWPKFLPFPRMIKRSRAPVPNRSSVDWPQSQWAPLYLPPGSPSFQPYSYLKNDVPLSSVQPTYFANNTTALTHGGSWQSGVGPGGDIAQTPYGGFMLSNPSPYRRRARYRRRVAANKRARAMRERSGRGRVARWAQLRRAALAAEGYPVVRMGARASSTPIPTGIPTAPVALMPEPIATAGLSSLYNGIALDNMGGLALDNFGGLALDNTGCYGGDCDDYGMLDYFMDEDGIKWGPTLLTAAIAFGAYNMYTKGRVF